MFGLLCSTIKKKWRLVEIDEDREVLVKLAGEYRSQRDNKWQNLTDEEKLLHAIFGMPVEYKIVRIEAAD